MKLNALLAVSTTCCALLVTTSMSLAQDDKQKQAGERDQSRLVALLDTNGDGKISASEIADEHKRLVTAADIDADGKLSVDEFKRRGRWFQALGATTLFDLMDTNGDQTLTLEEIHAPSKRWVTRYDGNGDDAIEESELPQRRMHRRYRR